MLVESLDLNTFVQLLNTIAQFLMVVATMVSVIVALHTARQANHIASQERVLSNRQFLFDRRIDVYLTVKALYDYASHVTFADLYVENEIRKDWAWHYFVLLCDLRYWLDYHIAGDLYIFQSEAQRAFFGQCEKLEGLRVSLDWLLPEMDISYLVRFIESYVDSARVLYGWSLCMNESEREMVVHLDDGRLKQDAVRYRKDLDAMQSLIQDGTLLKSIDELKLNLRLKDDAKKGVRKKVKKCRM